MEIQVAKKAGFCFGVKRAIDMAFKLAEEANGKAFTLGPVIHNPQVVEKLGNAGVIVTDDIDSLEIEALLIRTHGIAPSVYEAIKNKPYKVIDATCPFVKKAQHYASMLDKDGYQVIILGDRNHPEVISLLGFAGKNAHVISGIEEIPSLQSKVGIVVQTTKSVTTLKEVVAEIVGFVKEVKVYNTICDSTDQRLKETSQMATQVDVMIVVGGKNSANTTRLANLCREKQVPVYHIETSDEIKHSWFDNCQRVGITGGASTPAWIIDEVVETLKQCAS